MFAEQGRTDRSSQVPMYSVKVLCNHDFVLSNGVSGFGLGVIGVASDDIFRECVLQSNENVTIASPELAVKKKSTQLFFARLLQGIPLWILATTLVLTATALKHLLDVRLPISCGVLLP